MTQDNTTHSAMAWIAYAWYRSAFRPALRIDAARSASARRQARSCKAAIGNSEISAYATRRKGCLRARRYHRTHCTVIQKSDPRQMQRILPLTRHRGSDLVQPGVSKLGKQFGGHYFKLGCVFADRILSPDASSDSTRLAVLAIVLLLFCLGWWPGRLGVGAVCSQLNPFMFAVLPLPSYICMGLRIPNRAAPKLVGNCKTPGDQSQTKRSGFDVPRMCLLPSEKNRIAGSGDRFHRNANKAP